MLTKHQRRAADIVLALRRDPFLGRRNTIGKMSQASKISIEELVGTSRKAHVVPFRHGIFFLFRDQKYRLSYPEIARLTNRSDHTTVMYGEERMRAHIEEYESEVYGVKLTDELMAAPNLKVGDIEGRVSGESGTPLEEILGSTQRPLLTQLRAVVATLYHDRFELTPFQIGRLLSLPQDEVRMSIERMHCALKEYKFQP